MSIRALSITYSSALLLVLIYLILRSIYVPLVHDEAETFFIYFVNGHFLPYQGWVSANNHFLNSFLGHLSFLTFGPEEWALRLPNLIFVPIYGYYLFKLSATIKNTYIRFCALMALLGATFFTEFFALARGYGMAMAMLIVFLYHLQSYLSNKKFKPFLYAQITGFIGLLASLTLFYVFLIAMALMALDIVKSYIKREKNDNAFKIMSLLIFQLLPAVFFIILYPSFRECKRVNCWNIGRDIS